MADDKTDVVADATVETQPADQAAPTGDKTPPADQGGDDTVLGSATSEGDGKTAQVPADFPADWREKMAGDDKKFLSTLKRYSSPVTFAKAHQSLRQRMDSGELRSQLPKDATPEQIAAWRKDSGIPEKPDQYDIGGLAVSDDEKPAVGKFLETMHKANATPDVVKAALSAFYATKADIETQLAEHDAKSKMETEDALRAEFGADYRRNMMAGHNLLNGMPEGLKDSLMGARLANGNLFANDANALKWLVQTARELNPAATVVMGGADDSMKSIAARRAEIQKMRRENPDAYYKNEALQQEERNLIDAEMKLNKRNAA